MRKGKRDNKGPVYRCPRCKVGMLMPSKTFDEKLKIEYAVVECNECGHKVKDKGSV
jgi:DNA-directed RNA polymerase subunit RPC12/RpoP